jgi:hypothetical protein
VNRSGSPSVDSTFEALNSFPRGLKAGRGWRRSVTRRSERSACARAAQCLRLRTGDGVEIGGMSFSVSVELFRIGRPKPSLAGAMPACGMESRVKAGRGGISGSSDLDDRDLRRNFLFAEGPLSPAASRTGFGATSSVPELSGLGFKSLTNFVREGAAASKRD